MPGRGGKRVGAGRKKGSKSRPAFDIQKAAMEKAERAFKVLEEVAVSKRILPSTRVIAANSILDRAFGKPVQSTQMLGADGEPTAPVLVQIVAATPEDVARANADDTGDDDEEKGD